MKTFAYRIDWYKQGFSTRLVTLRAMTNGHVDTLGPNILAKVGKTWNTKAVDGITIIFTLSLMQRIVQQLIKNKTYIWTGDLRFI